MRALIGKSRRSNVRPIEKARKALDRSRRRCTGQRKRPIVPRAQFLYVRAGDRTKARSEKKNSEILRRRLPAQHRFRYQIGSLLWEILRLRTRAGAHRVWENRASGANSGSDFFRAVKKHLQCASTRKKRTLAFGFNRPSNAKTRHYTQHAPPAGRASRVRGFSEGTPSRPRARTRRSPLDRAARRAFPPGIEHTRGFSNHTWKR